MAKKKTEIKQNQKQTINITIGDRAVKRKRRGRPRKRQATGGGVQQVFTAPIINYPPNYVNPAVVQPIQQPQNATLVPKAPAGAPPAKQPRTALTAFPADETAPALGLDSSKPVKLTAEKEEKQRPISAFSTFDRRLARASQEAKLSQFNPSKLFRKSKKEFQATGDIALVGRDTNPGDMYEPGVSPNLVFNARTVLPPIGVAQGVWVPPGEAKPRRRRPEGLRPPDFPPPSEPTVAVRLKKDGTPDKRYLKKAQREAEEPVEPQSEPPEEAPLVPLSGEGIRFTGSSRQPAPAPPSLERQRPQGITPAEQTILYS